MASLTITVNDALVPDLLDALIWKFPNVDISGLGAAAAAKKFAVEFMRDVYKEYRTTVENTTLLAEYNAQFQAAKDAAAAEAAGITA